MRLSQLLGDRAETVVTFPGGDVHVTYRPSVYTREFEAKLQRVQELAVKVNNGENIDVTGDEDYLARPFYNQALCDLVVGWDLQTEDDELIELTPEAIDEKVQDVILIVFVLRLVQTIQGEAAGGRREQPDEEGETAPAAPTPANVTKMTPNRASRRNAPRSR